jgi:hypothetical protein
VLASPRYSILPQPDDANCGPTCLHSVYGYYGDRVSLAEVMAEVEMNPTGGTLACQLGRHALRRGYRTTLYTYNLMIFDPTWFQGEGVDLSEKLRAQAQAKTDPRLTLATAGYLDYLRLGGQIRLEDLQESLLRRYLDRGVPLMAGLSATYLYRSAREVGETETTYDDVRGVPCGHFVVIFGMENGQAMVADPLEDNPLHGDHLYEVPVDRLLSAILLGIVTYDATLLAVEPAEA